MGLLSRRRPDTGTVGVAAKAARVTLVTSEGCHLCEDAKEALASMARDLPLEITVVEGESAEGKALVAHHRPALMPLALLDGAMFSVGRLPRKKLRRAMEGRA